MNAQPPSHPEEETQEAADPEKHPISEESEPETQEIPAQIPSPILVLPTEGTPLLIPKVDKASSAFILVHSFLYHCIHSCACIDAFIPVHAHPVLYFWRWRRRWQSETNEVSHGGTGIKAKRRRHANQSPNNQNQTIDIDMRRWGHEPQTESNLEQ